MEIKFESVDPGTLFVTHICDGDEVVAGGEDGQVHIAVFASHYEANRFVESKQHLGLDVTGVRCVG